MSPNAPASRPSRLLLALLLILLPLGDALAIGLGNATVRSRLNQPLDAVVQVRLAPDEGIETDELRVRLASPAAHQAAGLVYPAALQGARFTLEGGADNPVIHIRTRQPVHEPLLAFLLELDWGRGRLLKEFTFLLDPPGYRALPRTAASETARPAADQTPRGEPLTEEGLPVFVSEPAPQVVEEVVEAAPRRPARRHRRHPIRIENNRYGPVRPGDTLSEIARAAARKTGKSTREMMRLIYRANPQAFLGSMDTLQKGVILRIPLDGGEEKPAQVAKQPPAAQEADKAAAPSAAPGSKGEAHLDILEQDQAATRIAQALSRELQRQRKEGQATTQARSGNLPGEQAAGGQAGPGEPTGKSPGEAEEPTGQDAPPDLSHNPAVVALQAELARLRETQKTLREALESSRNELAAAKAEIDRLNARVEELAALQTQLQRGQPGFQLQQWLRWLPWLLLALLVPLLAFFWLRNRAGREAEPGLEWTPPPEAPAPSADAPSPAPPGDAPAPATPPLASAFEAETEYLHKGPAGEAPPVPVETGPELAFEPDDLKPAAEDTQESIRPTLHDMESTQILQRDEGLEDTESALDAVQEAEIYLAYEQYSLAEKTINELLAADPDNDRYRFLQLKLFAETGRMNEMQELSVQLLQKYPDPDSGMHQQIQNVCERAFTRHAGETGRERSLPQSAQGELPELPQDEGEAETEDATAETLFTDDISDYLSEHTLSDLDSFTVVDALKATTFEDLDSLPEDADEAFDQLTDAEIEALSMELDMLNEEGETVATRSGLEETLTELEPRPAPTEPELDRRGGSEAPTDHLTEQELALLDETGGGTRGTNASLEDEFGLLDDTGDDDLDALLADTRDPGLTTEGLDVPFDLDSELRRLEELAAETGEEAADEGPDDGRDEDGEPLKRD